VINFSDFKSAGVKISTGSEKNPQTQNKENEILAWNAVKKNGYKNLTPSGQKRCRRGLCTTEATDQKKRARRTGGKGGNAPPFKSGRERYAVQCGFKS